LDIRPFGARSGRFSKEETIDHFSTFELFFVAYKDVELFLKKCKETGEFNK